jgi:hypothetical protein
VRQTSHKLIVQGDPPVYKGRHACGQPTAASAGIDFRLVGNAARTLRISRRSNANAAFRLWVRKASAAPSICASTFWVDMHESVPVEKSAARLPRCKPKSTRVEIQT